MGVLLFSYSSFLLLFLEKKGTTKSTKSTKKSFSFPLWPSCSSWFKAFMLFATPSKSGICHEKWISAYVRMRSGIHRREFLKLFRNRQKFCCGLYCNRKFDRMRRNEYQTGRYSHCLQGKSCKFVFTKQSNAKGDILPWCKHQRFLDSRERPQRKLSANHAALESHCVFPVHLSH